jgi:hypothetical protein
LEHINATAYTSASYRQRTSANTIHDFVQGFDSYPDDSLNINILSPFQKTRRLHTLYSGDRWTSPLCYDTITPGADPDSYQVFSSVWNCLANDYPVIQICATNSGPNVSGLAFNFVATGWTGIAPLVASSAGSMPYETVPFLMPSWMNYARLVGYGDNAADVVNPIIRSVEMMESSLAPVAQQVLRTVSPSSLKQIVSNGSTGGPPQRSIGSKILNLLENAGSTALNVFSKSGIPKAIGDSLSSKVLTRTENALKSLAGRVLPNAGSIMEVVEEAAPLLITAV